ncbi:hypothetical protein GCM10009000_112510 [Halobacterium noricense]
MNHLTPRRFTFRGKGVVYGARTTDNDDCSTLATVDGRVCPDYVTPEDDDGTHLRRYRGSSEWERTV